MKFIKEILPIFIGTIILSVSLVYFMSKEGSSGNGYGGLALLIVGFYIAILFTVILLPYFFLGSDKISLKGIITPVYVSVLACLILKIFHEKMSVFIILKVLGIPMIATLYSIYFAK